MIEIPAVPPNHRSQAKGFQEDRAGVKVTCPGKKPNIGKSRRNDMISDHNKENGSGSPNYHGPRKPSPLSSTLYPTLPDSGNGSNIFVMKSLGPLVFRTRPLLGSIVRKPSVSRNSPIPRNSAPWMQSWRLHLAGLPAAKSPRELCLRRNAWP